MNENKLSSEEKKKYENEFCEFLIERIKNVGGSLQFQHLMGLLPQLKYETKKAVGSTKSELMKFLKTHHKKFKVDAKGIVSVIDSSVSDTDSDTNNKNNEIEEMNSLPSSIQEGAGSISRIFPEYGFINAIEPFETSVYFTALEFGEDKDSLLTDFELEVGTEVCFNAIKGHKDYETKYRATKVWRQPTSDDESVDKYNENKTRNLKNNLDGEGKIQKICPELGFISVDDKENVTVFFHRNDFNTCNDNDDLTKILKPGDRVIFHAVRSERKDARAKWQATKVYKKVKKPKECAKPDNVPSRKKEIIKDQNGKIFPRTNGATIKFGEKFTQSANGDSSVFFLYGAQVSDIAWEFSEGDDVHFDAVKIKSEPGWKAIMVWVGDRPDFVLPTCLGDFSEFIDEEDFNEENQSTSSSSIYFSESCNSSLQSIDVKSKLSHSNAKQIKKENVESRRHFAQRGKNESERTFRKKKFQLSRDSTLSSFSSMELDYKKQDYKKQKEEHKNKIHNLNKLKGSSSKSVKNYDHLNHGKDHKSKNHESGYSKLENQNQTIDYPEHENFSNSKIYAMRKKELNNTSAKHKFLSNVQEAQTDRNSDINDHVLKTKKKIPGIASVKSFKGIEGTVTKVLCKVAFAENPELQKEIAFFSNVFYNNGHSVEDQQAEDLREIISPGDTIQMNCFEVIDDFGDYHPQVTMAWCGTEPEIDEMTPDEYIAKNDLSVTQDDKSDIANKQSKSDTPRKFLNAVSDSDSDSENVYLSDCQDELASFHSSSDEEITSSLNDFTPEVHECTDSKKEMDSISVHHRPLHEIISDRLKSKGVFFSHSKVNLDAVSTEIIDVVLKHHKIEVVENHHVKASEKGSDGVKITDSVCSSCLQKNNGTFANSDAKSLDKEVQTIITGEIVAQSIFTMT